MCKDCNKEKQLADVYDYIMQIGYEEQPDYEKIIAM